MFLYLMDKNWYNESSILNYIPLLSMPSTYICVLCGENLVCDGDFASPLLKSKFSQLTKETSSNCMINDLIDLNSEVFYRMNRKK